jgi:hypothetical protein
MTQENNISVFNDTEWFQLFSDTYNSHVLSVESLENQLSDLGEEEYKSDALFNSIEMNKKQMCVLFCSYIEVIIKDFLFTVFLHFPEKMCPFLPKEFSNHCTDLFKITSLTKKDISVFAKISANKAFSFDLNRTLNIINKLGGAGTSLDENYKKNFKILFDFRNKLIHENLTEQLEPNNLINYMYLKIGIDFIKDLGVICDNLDIHRTNKQTEINLKELSKELAKINF